MIITYDYVVVTVTLVQIYGDNMLILDIKDKDEEKPSESSITGSKFLIDFIPGTDHKTNWAIDFHAQYISINPHSKYYYIIFIIYIIYIPLLPQVNLIMLIFYYE